MSKDFVVKLSKPGFDVMTTDDKNLQMSSEFDSHKIAKTGVLTVELPAETFAGETKTRTDTYSHGLGYVPMYLPAVTDLKNGNSGTTDDYVCNDNAFFVPLILGYSPWIEGEGVRVYITTTQLVLEVNRVALGPVAFGAHDVVFYYTVLYNQVDTEFNLL